MKLLTARLFLRLNPNHGSLQYKNLFNRKNQGIPVNNSVLKKHLFSILCVFFVFPGLALSKTPSERCGKSIEVTSSHFSSWNGIWAIVSENPLSILSSGYRMPLIEVQFNDLHRNLDYDINNGSTTQSDKQSFLKLKNWISCLTDSEKLGAGTQQASTNSPNCPPTLPSSCVSWSLYDNQLHWWNLTNNCGRDVSVTFPNDGGLEDSPVFGSGETTRITWRGSNPPPHIILDANKSRQFYSKKPTGAVLKCKASLQF